MAWEERAMNFTDFAIYVAFNGRVFAIDRRDGSVLWRWKVPKGGSFVTLLPDGDQVLVCSDGYLWALRAADGTPLWNQPFKGEGTGIPVLASPRAALGAEQAVLQLCAEAAENDRRRAATAASSNNAN